MLDEAMRGDPHDEISTLRRRDSRELGHSLPCEDTVRKWHLQTRSSHQNLTLLAS